MTVPLTLPGVPSRSATRPVVRILACAAVAFVCWVCAVLAALTVNLDDLTDDGELI